MTLSVLSTATPVGAANLLEGVVVAFSNLATLWYLRVKTLLRFFWVGDGGGIDVASYL